MTEFINSLFGTGKELTILQMCARAFVFFFITLSYLRIGGVRTLGKKSAIDMVIVIVLGSLIARGITGASGFVATAAASAVLVLTHRLLACLSIKSNKLENIAKGGNVMLYSNGQFHDEAFKKVNLSMNEFFESLRLAHSCESLEYISHAYMEASGKLSFITKS